MTTLNIEGHKVQVDDSFLQLSPDQQNATVEEIAKSLSASDVQSADARAKAGIERAKAIQNGAPRTQIDPMTGQPAGVPAFAPPQRQPGYASDMLASGASGFGRGAADLVGLPGTVGDALRGAGQWALRKGYQATTGNEAKPGTFFGGPTPEAESAMIGGGSNPIGGTNLKIGLSKLTGGASDYQPRSVPGEYARTAGEFLPAAMAFGGLSPGSLIGNAAIPAATSETAGQLTKGTQLEPYARLAGALAGGIAGNALTKPASAQLPTAADIRASAGYNELKAPMKGATITKDAYQGIVNDLWNEANDFGLTTQLKGEVQGTLNDFAARAQNGGTPSLYDLEVLRRSLRNIGGNKLDGPAQALSQKLIENLDNNVENLSAASIAANGETGKPVLDALQEARAIYRIGAKSQLIENAINNAQNAASGTENGLRIEFRKLLKPGVVENFTDGERKLIEQVARGNIKTNILRWFGSFGVPTDNGRNFLGSVMGGGIGGTIGSMVGGPAGAMVGGPMLMGAGTLARMASNAATSNNAALAEALVKAGPAGNQLLSEAMAQASAAGKEALMRAALQARSAVQVPVSKVPVR